MNFTRLKQNLGGLLGLALATMAFLHSRQLGTAAYAASPLIGLEYFVAFGLALVVLFYHPSHAAAALFRKEKVTALRLLLNTLAGALLLLFSLWLDAPTLLRFN